MTAVDERYGTTGRRAPDGYDAPSGSENKTRRQARRWLKVSPSGRASAGLWPEQPGRGEGFPATSGSPVRRA